MKSHQTSSVARAVRAAAAVLLAGCGAGQEGPMAPPTAPPTGLPAPAAEEPTYGAASSADTSLSSPEDALAALDSAEGELARALGQPAFAQPPAATPAAPDAPMKSPAPEPAQQSAGGLYPGAGSACGTACRALASMERAAEHLCGLVGEAERRCEGARGRVKSASERVQAQCPRCGDG